MSAHVCLGVEQCGYCDNSEPPYEYTEEDRRADEHWEAIEATHPDFALPWNENTQWGVSL